MKAPALLTNLPLKVPQLIALCGYPNSGKSSVQKILAERFAVEPVDDGLPLRKIAMDWFGLAPEDVFTQEGKTRHTEILGRRWQNREILGELGNRFEDMIGDFAMPFMSTRKLDPSRSYSFGSVRKNQGLFYQSLGGIIIGITRPGTEPSPYAFDKFDASIVDFWISNDGSVSDLEKKVIAVLQCYTDREREAA